MLCSDKLRFCISFIYGYREISVQIYDLNIFITIDLSKIIFKSFIFSIHVVCLSVKWENFFRKNGECFLVLNRRNVILIEKIQNR